MEVTYVADLEHRDVMIAVYALYYLGFLDYMVCYPEPLSPEARGRLREIKDLGIKVKRKLKGKNNSVVIVNAPLGCVSRYLRKSDSHIKTLVVAGGYVGCNIKGSTETKEYSMVSNFNEELLSTVEVLSSSYTKIDNIYLVTRNVYSSFLNYEKGIWSSYEFWELFQNIEVKDRYIPQYALLTVMEGLHIALESQTRCEYVTLYPKFESSEGRKTLWGSSTYYAGMGKVHAAVRLRYNKGT